MKKEYRIKASSNNYTTTTGIAVNDYLAIVKSYDYQTHKTHPRKYTLLHIPTGESICCSALPKARITAIWERLKNLNIDWFSLETIKTNTPEKLAELRQIINQSYDTPKKVKRK